MLFPFDATNCYAEGFWMTSSPRLDRVITRTLHSRWLNESSKIDQHHARTTPLITTFFIY